MPNARLNFITFMRTALSLIFSVWLGLSASAQQAEADSCTANRLIAFAETFLGVPYRPAGKTPKGFDCSGFVHYVFARFGVAVPPSSAAYERVGREIPLSEARIGDILVFTGTNAAVRRPGHVGIVTAADQANPKFIHASSAARTYRVTFNCLKDGSYSKRFLKVVRVLP